MLLLALGVLSTAIFSPTLRGSFHWMELEWVQVYYALAVRAAAAVTIILWQYAQRRTLPWTSACTLQMRLSPQKMDSFPIHIGLDLEKKWLGHVYPEIQNRMVIDLPLQFSGIPAGIDLKANGLTVTLLAPDGRLGAPSNRHRSLLALKPVLFFGRVAGNTFYERVRDRSFLLRGTLVFALYGNRRETSIPLFRRRR